MKRTAITLIAGGVVVSVLFALSVILGAPQPPPPLESINAPFRSVDFSGLAQIQRYPARDGARLAFFVPTRRPQARPKGPRCLSMGRPQAAPASIP